MNLPPHSARWYERLATLFEVPELFPNPEVFYAWRAWGFAPQEAPSYQEVAPVLERIFRQYAGPQGLEVRRRRHIWNAVIPERREG